MIETTKNLQRFFSSWMENIVESVDNKSIELVDPRRIEDPRRGIGRSCMYSAYEQYLLKFTRHILISVPNIRVAFLRSRIRFIQLEMVRC